MKPVICTMSDSTMYWYLAVLLESIGWVEADIVIGDLGLEPWQVERASTYGTVVKLNPRSECVKADLLRISARNQPTIYMDCDMLAMVNPLQALDLTEGVGICPNRDGLDQLVRYYFPDRRNRYKELCRLIGAHPESLKSLNSGFVVARYGVRELADRWMEICKKLRRARVPLLSLRHRPVSDQLALVLYAASSFRVSVLPREWNFPPIDPVSYDEIYRVDGRPIQMVHYLATARPDVPELMKQAPGKLGNQDHPLIRLWKHQAKRIGRGP